MGLSLEPVTEAVWVDEHDDHITLSVASWGDYGQVDLTDAEADRVANALMRVVEARYSQKETA